MNMKLNAKIIVVNKLCIFKKIGVRSRIVTSKVPTCTYRYYHRSKHGAYGQINPENWEMNQMLFKIPILMILIEFF